jgi:hypothetical protein
MRRPQASSCRPNSKGPRSRGQVRIIACVSVQESTGTLELPPEFEDPPVTRTGRIIAWAAVQESGPRASSSNRIRRFPRSPGQLPTLPRVRYRNRGPGTLNLEPDLDGPPQLRGQLPTLRGPQYRNRAHTLQLEPDSEGPRLRDGLNVGRGKYANSKIAGIDSLRWRRRRRSRSRRLRPRGHQSAGDSGVVELAQKR